MAVRLRGGWSNLQDLGLDVEFVPGAHRAGPLHLLEAETQVTAEVAAQGVMTATEQQVEALVFLNQFTIRKGEESVFTPYRLKVTLIDTEQGWLVSDVEAA